MIQNATARFNGIMGNEVYEGSKLNFSSSSSPAPSFTITANTVVIILVEELAGRVEYKE